MRTIGSLMMSIFLTVSIESYLAARLASGDFTQTPAVPLRAPPRLQLEVSLRQFVSRGTFLSGAAIGERSNLFPVF
jgi:hypothetical protein